jgi:fructose-1,6-bisphosphatase II
MNASVPDRNLALELIRVTEAAALAAARWSGAGDKIAADQAAVDAMRTMFDTVAMHGVVVIGEGEKDEAPMLFNGEHVGDGSGPEVDVAVDPLEGTTLVARGMPNALAVVAIAEKGAMFDPGPCVYMEKMAGGADIADLLSLEDPMEDVLRRIADKRGVSIGDLMIVILDRPRHNEMVERIRRAGARIRFISDGAVAGALLAARDGTGVDLLWGIGGTPEGVLSATALKCLGGMIIGRLWPRDEGEASRARAAGYDLDRVLHLEDLVAGENCFFAATGVTDGSLLDGVRYDRGGASTHSIVMRASSGTVRLVHARHDRAKLRAIAGERYG